MPAPSRLAGVILRTLAVSALVLTGGASPFAARTAEPVRPAGPPATGLDLSANPLEVTVRPGRIPRRPSRCLTGSQFAAATDGLEPRDRHRRALEELRRGNLPDFLRQFVPVSVRDEDSTGDSVTAVIWVSPDYLAIGDDRDFLRIPLNYPTAAAVANVFGCVLPTRKMVDAIYRSADVKLAPRPMRPGPSMRSTGYYLRHQKTIEAQRAGAPGGALVAGHKKDVVISNRLYRKPGRIAIYGWHRLSGRPIQPLSTAHGAEYADYSHGIRLVYGWAWVEGQWRDVLEVLEDPQEATVLSYEGVIAHPQQLMNPRARW